MKVILSGGGTGGHIYPALTIADAIKKECPDAEIFFVGTKEGLEKNIIPRYGYELKFIEVAGFKRSLSFDTVRSFFKLFSGLADAYKIVADAKPFAEVMNARAKGTTIYEMIDQFGGIDNLTQVLAVKEAEAVYADVSDVPEMANDAEYAGVLKKLQAQIDELKKSSKVEEKVEDPKTEGDIK